MDRKEDEDRILRKAFRPHSSVLRGPRIWVLIASVCSYGLVTALLALFQGQSLALLAGTLALLVFLSAGVFIAGLLEARSAGQRAFLALSMVPALTIARLVFADTALPILSPLLVYLLLAAALMTFPASERASLGLRGLNRGAVLRALLLGAVLAVGFVVLGLVLPPEASSSALGSFGISLLAIVPSAFVDEFWFRGILQSGLSESTSRNLGWLATLALFVAYGAPFGNLYALLFRSAYGAVFGAVARGRGNLPVTLVARTCMATALLAIVPGFAGRSLLV
jgi:hypothetical protein